MNELKTPEEVDFVKDIVFGQEVLRYATKIVKKEK